MKRSVVLICGALVLLSLLFITSISCTGKPTPSVDDSIVQVGEPAATGEPAALLAFGIVVGDGSQVLTVLNYEDYTPDSLEIILPGRGKYQASIQAIDPRTSATLLQFKGAKLPVAATGDSAAIRADQKVIVRGWLGTDFRESKAIVAGIPETSDIFFHTYLSEQSENEALEKGGWGIFVSGTPVTDDTGKVLGIIGPFYYKLIPQSIPVGWIPPVVTINSALELFTPEATSRPWANGPVRTVLTTGEETIYYDFSLKDMSAYPQITAAIQELLGNLGPPLAGEELPEYYNTMVWPYSTDGTLLTAVYARPVELRNAEGNVLAQAKWVGIQWGRSEGKFNRLLYGWVDNASIEYHVEGGFELSGEVADLENVLQNN